MSNNAFEQQVRDDGIAEDQAAQAKAERYRDEILRRDAFMNAAQRAVAECQMAGNALRAAGYTSCSALAFDTASQLARALAAFRRDADYDTAKKLAEFGGKL